MNTNSAGAVVVLGYTSTAIDVISAKVYTVEAIQGANFVLDVGVNGSKEAIVKDEAIGITGADTIVNCTVDTTRVAAGKMIIASVSTADGTGGNIAIAIEYREVIT
jgi:predicted ATP-grasp superfamily ATP-dependent carboligase